MDRIAEESLLFDYYGNLLTEKKRRVMELYHEENLSLSEIAEEFGITRAAVHDSLKSARKQLAGYEERLGLVRQMDLRICPDRRSRCLPDRSEALPHGHLSRRDHAHPLPDPGGL